MCELSSSTSELWETKKTGVEEEQAVHVEKDTDEELGDRGGGGKKLACRFCHGLITTQGDAIEKEGKYRHTFFNPAGILFEVACFSMAPGCVVSGQPTSEFSWFKGYLWQYASCRSCDAHLGWCFSGAGPSFFGLIFNRLVEVEEPDARSRE